VTLKNCNAKNKSDVCIPNFRAPPPKKNKSKTRKTKTSQTVNKNNPAQNFFSIAQF
jgi:hypothetical protein